MHFILVVLAWFPAKSNYVPPISQAIKIESFKTETDCWNAWITLGVDWHKTNSSIQIAGSCIKVDNDSR